MPDNTTTPIVDGTPIATDEIGGVHYQRTKVTFGADGSATDVSTANPLPVAGPLTDGQMRATPVPVALNDHLTLTGFQARIPTTGPKASSGSVSIAPATDATFAVSATALPLPAGAATNAKLDTLIAAVNEQRSGDKFVAIVPADANLATIPDMIFVGGAGNLVVRGSDGVDATFAVAAGATLPIRPTQVRAATTASGIVGISN